MELGSNIRVARIAAGLKPKGLADAAGISMQALHKIESGQNCCKSSTLCAISKALGVSLDYLMCCEGVSIRQACQNEIKRADKAQEDKRAKARAAMDNYQQGEA